MNKKIFILLVLTFFLSGCDATYNVNLDESADECTHEIVISDIESKSKAENILINDDFAQNNIDYFTKEYIENDGVVSLNLKTAGNDFLIVSYNKYIDSYLQYSEAENEIYIFGISSFDYIFNIYDIDSLTINISSKYILNESNADSVKDNVATWIITSDNYKDKEITTSYSRDEYIISKREKMDVYILFSLIVLIILIILLFIYSVFKIKKKRINKL